jgi:DNA-binding FrmR family transcriptional regulator
MNTKDLKKRLHYLKGQIDGIERMLDDGRDPNDIYIQFKAVEGALQKAIYVVLDDTLRKDLAQKIVKVVDACPGNCGDEDKIEYIRQEFPKLDLKKIARIISEIQAIDEKLEKINGETEE